MTFDESSVSAEKVSWFRRGAESSQCSNAGGSESEHLAMQAAKTSSGGFFNL